jgi:CRISPR-associated protein Csm4
MNYCLYKLRFKTALHIGEDSGGSHLASSEITIHADTLYSALCIEALKTGGQTQLKALYNIAKNDDLRLSDLFPFIGEEYYLPKPVISIDSQNQNDGVKDRKEFKKLAYIPATGFLDYISYLKGKGEFDVEKVKCINQDLSGMGSSEVRNCAAISGREETLPYYVGTYSFRSDKKKPECGLYLIVGFKDEDAQKLVERLLNSLSYSGIGGKRTSGLGKFELDDVIFLDDAYCQSQKILNQLLCGQNTNIKMALSVCLPQDNELDEAAENSSYLLVRRGGFVQSTSYAQDPLKKQVIYAFGAGSCFKKPFHGDVYDVSCNGSHSVYRYLKPLFGGLDV